MSPALRATARAATIGIGVTSETCAALRDLGGRRVVQMPQAALSDEEVAFFDRFPTPQCLWNVTEEEVWAAFE